MPRLRYLRDLTIKERLIRRLKGMAGFGTMEKYKTLLREWRHHIEPEFYGRGSSTDVLWVCARDPRHIYLRPINRRTNAIDRGSKHGGCPYCAGRKSLSAEGLKFLYPGLGDEWVVEINGPADEVNPHSHRLAVWRCSNGHLYSCVVYERVVDDQGCPECSTDKKNNLVANPELAKHLMLSVRNVGYDPRRLPVDHKVWWRCVREPNHAEFYRSLSQLRQTQASCPQCRRKDTSTLADFPALMLEFERRRNNNIDPSKLLANSSLVVTWICPRHRQYPFKAEVWKRCLRGDRCPYCSRKRACADNCLAVTHPAVAAELHPTKNGAHTAKTLLATSKIICVFCCSKCGYEYSKQLRTRTNSSTCCPQCQHKTPAVPSSDGTAFGVLDPGSQSEGFGFTATD